MRNFLQAGLAALAAFSAFACQAFAGPAAGVAPAPAAAGFSEDQAVDPASLDQFRGGFTDPSGLAVSLGIERILTVNGNVADRSQLNFGDLGGLASGKTTLSAEAASQMRLIQHGNGGVNVSFGPQVLGGTVIQNSLNNQLINNATIINASVDAKGMLQTMNFQSTLSNALNSAATVR